MEIVREAISAHRSAAQDQPDGEGRVARLLAFWAPSCEYTSVAGALEFATHQSQDKLLRGRTYPSREEALADARARE